MSVAEASIKRSEQIRSLDYLTTGIKIGSQRIHVDENVLFSRLVAIIQRDESVESYFEHELTAVPTSLFNDTLMRKPAKSQLTKYLTENVELMEPIKEAKHVLDGGALLYKVKWAKKKTYKQTAIQYVT